jgi:hypothetical protein
MGLQYYEVAGKFANVGSVKSRRGAVYLLRICKTEQLWAF